MLAHAYAGDDLTQSFAWVIATYCNPNSEPFVPALGLDSECFNNLLQTRFPDFTPPQAWLVAQTNPVVAEDALSEFPDLLQLLLDHRSVADPHHLVISHLVATACMGGNHLWQDLGLPQRDALSTLLNSNFPLLAAHNTGDMKWKKFFYKQLCEREGIKVCRSPSCDACSDYDQCFGSEEEEYANLRIVR
jgi:nitrogen fixation protein NifQ